MHSRRTGGEQDVNIAISSLDVGEIRKREDETKNTNSSSFYDSDLIKDRSKRRTFASFFFPSVYCRWEFFFDGKY